MKKIMSVLLFLLILAPLASANQNPIPYRSLCGPVTEHAKEIEWCMEWEQTLALREELRSANENDIMWLQVLVIPEYDEGSQRLAVSTTEILVSPWFAGQKPWIMANLELLQDDEWKKTLQDVSEKCIIAFKLNMRGLAASVRRLECSERENYKSVEGMDEKTILRYPIDSNSVTCRSADALR